MTHSSSCSFSSLSSLSSSLFSKKLFISLLIGFVVVICVGTFWVLPNIQEGKGNEMMMMRERVLERRNEEEKMKKNLEEEFLEEIKMRENFIQKTEQMNTQTNTFQIKQTQRKDDVSVKKVHLSDPLFEESWHLHSTDTVPVGLCFISFLFLFFFSLYFFFLFFLSFIIYF